MICIKNKLKLKLKLKLNEMNTQIIRFKIIYNVY